MDGKRAQAFRTADYELVADLAFTYGRLEELRWRLRVRTEQREDGLDAMTIPLVKELQAEVTDRVWRVRAEIKLPRVRPVGLARTVRAGFIASAARVGTPAVTTADE